MTVIADSSAFKDQERLLPQHQAALTLLQSRLSAPRVERFSWLDLACGRGQIILSLGDNLSLGSRAKVDFYAYDLKEEHARETRRIAKELDFCSLHVAIGELSDFDRILPEQLRFDYITLTNTVNELDPFRFVTLLGDAIQRMTDNGTLFVYDMDKIKPSELGALPWKRDDVRRVLRRMLDGLGIQSYSPDIPLWKHRTCNGWSLELGRQHFGISAEVLDDRMEDAVRQAHEEVSQMLNRRLVECRESLETLTLFGAETREEQDDKERLLFEFWAISRASEQVP